MAEGVIIYNQDGRVQIDNSTAYTLEVIEEGVLANYSTIGDSTDVNALLFVRADPGASIWGTTDNLTGGWTGLGTNAKRLQVDFGSIHYIKAKNCMNTQVASGYGLSVYNTLGSPSLVFSSDIRYIRLLAELNLTPADSVISMSASLPGKNKYIGAHSLYAYNFNTNSTDTVRVVFSSDGSSIFLGSQHFNLTWGNTNGATVSYSRNFNIIEC